MFNLNLELHSGLKVRGSEINFINKKLLESKNPRGFVIPVLKVEVTNPQGFFFEQLLFNKVGFRPPNFEADVQLQI